MSALDPLRAGAPPVAGASRAAERSGDDARLRRAAQQLQGVFVQELLKAMRATVPQGEGAVDGGAGEELFTGLMDQHLAVDTPQVWAQGLGDAIHAHMRGRVAPASSPDAAASPGAPAPALPGLLPIVASPTTSVLHPAPPTGPEQAPARGTASPQSTLTALRAAGR